MTQQYVAYPSPAASGIGTVTSVALSNTSDPIYTVTGSPVTSAGTINNGINTQNANLIFAGPSTGGAAIPSFRSLVSADYATNSVFTGTLSTNGNISTSSASASTLQFIVTNTNSAANVVSRVSLTNDASVVLRSEITSSNATQTGPALTNGPTGPQANYYTSGAYPLTLGTNSTAAVLIDASQNVTTRGTLTPFSGIVGSNGAAAAAAGIVGEIITATNTTGVSLTNNTTSNITSIALTAGDWDIWAIAAFINSGVTITNSKVKLATTNSDMTLSIDGTYAEQPFALSGSSNNIVGVSCFVPVRVSTTTNYFLNMQAAFTLGTSTAKGTIYARRRR